MAKTRRSGLLINLSDEDIAWGQRQDRWNCAIVRSIQRQVPEALYVTADTKGISFSIPEDDLRYTFDVPSEITENVIRNFDQGQPIPEEFRSFTVVARSAEPMRHVDRNNRKNSAEKRRNTSTRRRNRSPVVHTTNRFLDAEAGE